jgi:hypothetical protein
MFPEVYPSLSLSPHFIPLASARSALGRGQMRGQIGEPPDGPLKTVLRKKARANVGARQEHAYYAGLRARSN